MKTVILSTHGAADFTRQTTVPARVTVIFYQPFGKPLDNEVGKPIQTELTHRGHTTVKSVALWNGPHSFHPYITLSGESAGIGSVVLPSKWADFCDSATGNPRVINPKEFRVVR